MDREPIEVHEEDLVPLAWGGAEDERMTVDQWGQREYNQGVSAGCRLGRQTLLQHISHKAGQAFVNRQDDQARLLRELVVELQNLPT